MKKLFRKKLGQKRSMSEFKKFFLSHPELWFNAAADDDKFIVESFSHLILSDYDFSKDSILEQILVYDQLTRHMKRLNLIQDIEPYDVMARELVYKNINKIEIYSPIERCFFLMPLRHTFNADIIENQLLPLVLNWRMTEDTSEYRRFYQATLISLADLKKPIDVKPRRKTLDPTIFDPRSCTNVDQITDLNQKIKIKYQNIVVSLSGGVDSMICLKLVHQLNRKDMNIVAIHINYGNRDSADEEEEACRHYCHKLGIRLYVRHITEIKRNRSFDRDFYEQITRKIRFNSYKEFKDYAIVLGHNKDDSLENIFSNIKKKIHYDNLLGMSEESIENNVTILRPLLDMNKVEIIDLAVKNNIPFVYDSTPDWSDRGKMRDQLIPHIKGFDSNILEGLISMAKQYREIYQMAEDNIENVRLEYGEGWVIFEECSYSGLYYWKQIFYKVTTYLGIPMIANKSIINFIGKYEPNSRKEIHLSKYLYVIGNKCIMKG